MASPRPWAAHTPQPAPPVPHPAPPPPGPQRPPHAGSLMFCHGRARPFRERVWEGLGWSGGLDSVIPHGNISMRCRATPGAGSHGVGPGGGGILQHTRAAGAGGQRTGSPRVGRTVAEDPPCRPPRVPPCPACGHSPPLVRPSVAFLTRVFPVTPRAPAHAASPCPLTSTHPRSHPPGPRSTLPPQGDSPVPRLEQPSPPKPLLPLRLQ